MALGLLLWVSWISVLFNGSTGLPASKGIGYPRVTDWRNIMEDTEDELHSDWSGSNSYVTNYENANDRKPSREPLPHWVLVSQNVPDASRIPEVHKPVAGGSREGLGGRDLPLVFPLKPDNLLRKPLIPHRHPIQAPSTPTSPSSGSSSGHMKPQPGPPSQGTQAQSVLPGQPELAGSSGLHNQHLNTDGDIHRPIFEEVFQYPSQAQSPPARRRFSFPKRHRNVGAWPGFLSRKPSVQSEEQTIGTKVKVSQEVGNQVLVPPTHIRQSSNGYYRRKTVSTHSKYTPEFQTIAVSSKGVKTKMP